MKGISLFFRGIGVIILMMLFTAFIVNVNTKPKPLYVRRTEGISNISKNFYPDTFRYVNAMGSSTVAFQANDIFCKNSDIFQC